MKTVGKAQDPSIVDWLQELLSGARSVCLSVISGKDEWGVTLVDLHQFSGH
ncbi:hypothetical protein EV688_1043 [Chromatocurvus halotolerans]|uniref:Uncharacterized protein n=1 Tax=Chromatocurvus halotolerans TaxID=1132028 RepID=A0A4R2KYQ2_9GAMM|nr:hypothetical protein EV688_1043 [Chromatocurvus halotolerans]